MVNDTRLHDIGTIIPTWVPEMSMWTYGALALATLFFMEWFNGLKVPIVIYHVLTTILTYIGMHSTPISQPLDLQPHSCRTLAPSSTSVRQER